MKTTLTALLVGVAATFGIMTGGLAHADPDNGPDTDGPDTAGFLLNLARYGVSYDDQADAVTQGNAICDGFRSGKTFTEVTNVVKDSGHSDFDSGVIVGAATANLCPDQESKAKGTAVIDW